ncbi:MAG: lipopolysaccharide heptosyltransferase I [Candidatus Aminicenantes bacterium]|nr:lipopolysaccharide heptosyltransferase I [Candidatus Aminicenantes bacterium]
MNRFLLIRLSSLGDIIHTLPAFSVLREKNTESRITWLVEEKGKEILDCIPGIDKIVVLKQKKNVKQILNVRQKIREKNQIVFDFQGLLKSAFFAALSGARRRIGFSRKNLREPAASFFYNDRLKPFPENIHVIDKNLKLLSKLGLEKTGDYSFPLVLPEDIEKETENKLHKFGIKAGIPFILVNVGAAWESKRWSAEKWIQTIGLLSAEKKPIILLWGSIPEQKLAEKIAAKTKVPMAPFLSIKEVLAWLKRAALVISGDTFALHAACALGRPVVGIFGPTDPQRNGPIGLRKQVVFHALECSKCYKRKCSRMDCLETISPDEVFEKSRELLKP